MKSTLSHPDPVQRRNRLSESLRWAGQALRTLARILLSLGWLVPIICMGLIFWLFYEGYFPLKGKNIEERGQFGDSFGVLTSLFTGLGFGGLVVTLLVQQRQLQQQEDQIKLQRQSEQTRHYEEILHRLLAMYSATLDGVSTKGNLRALSVLRGSTDRVLEAIKKEKVHLVPLRMQERYAANALSKEDEVFLDYLYFRNFKILSVEIDRQGRLTETLKVLLQHLVYRAPQNIDIKPYCDMVCAQLSHIEVSYFFLIALTFKDESALRDLLMKCGLLERAAYVHRLRIHDYMYEQFWGGSIRAYKQPQLLPIGDKRINAAIRSHRRAGGSVPPSKLKAYTSPRTRQPVDYKGEGPSSQ